MGQVVVAYPPSVSLFLLARQKQMPEAGVRNYLSKLFCTVKDFWFVKILKKCIKTIEESNF